jgi:hypothetical protein
MEEHFFGGLGDGVLGLLTASPWCIFFLVNDTHFVFFNSSCGLRQGVRCLPLLWRRRVR